MKTACQPCRRLIAAGCLPEQAGRPAQVQLHLTLDQLRGLDGADELWSVIPKMILVTYKFDGAAARAAAAVRVIRG